MNYPEFKIESSRSFLGESFLGFIPNKTERRYIDEQRQAQVLNKQHAYRRFFSKESIIFQSGVLSKKDFLLLTAFNKETNLLKENAIEKGTLRIKEVSMGRDDILSLSKTEMAFINYIKNNFTNFDHAIYYAKKENNSIAEKMNALSTKKSFFEELENPIRKQKAFNFSYKGR